MGMTRVALLWERWETWRGSEEDSPGGQTHREDCWVGMTSVALLWERWETLRGSEEDSPGGLLGGNDEGCLAVGEVGDLKGNGGRLTGRTAGWE